MPEPVHSGFKAAIAPGGKPGFKIAPSHQISGCTSRAVRHFLLNPLQHPITQSNISTVWMPSISVRVIKSSRALGKHGNEDTAACWWDRLNSQSVSYSFDPQLKGGRRHKADKLRSRGRGQAQDNSICFLSSPPRKHKKKKKKKTQISKDWICDAIRQIYRWERYGCIANQIPPVQSKLGVLGQRWSTTE